MNHRAKFDAASCILDGEIRNRTNTHSHKITKNQLCHMPILRPHAALFHERRISSAAYGSRAH